MAKDLKQLYEGNMLGNKAITAIKQYVLSSFDKEKALDAVNIPKNNIYGTLKGRTCKNSSKHRKYFREGEIIASPTVSLKELLITLIIDSCEEIYVATFDVPGAYLHANIPERKTILLNLQGCFVNIMCDINP